MLQIRKIRIEEITEVSGFTYLGKFLFFLTGFIFLPYPHLLFLEFDFFFPSHKISSAFQQLLDYYKINTHKVMFESHVYDYM